MSFSLMIMMTMIAISEHFSARICLLQLDAAAAADGHDDDDTKMLMASAFTRLQLDDNFKKHQMFYPAMSLQHNDDDDGK